MIIGEQVTVTASFGGRDGVRPLRFTWNGRVILVKEVTYRWVQQEGSKRLHFFSLTDGSSLYSLYFDPAGLRWGLQAVETEL